MPAPKRTGRSGPTKGQSTLSFQNKITKSVPGNKGHKSKSVVSAVSSQASEPQKASLAEEREVDDDVASQQPEQESEPEEAPPKSEVELEAERISERQIYKYWRSVESQRRAPRVHQEDLDMSEKVLRYFDVSSQFGPCIGVSRLKRWYRAERLGLHPPIEVLALLLKGPQDDCEDIQTAHMDQILNSIALGS